jgi:hypothetical protein
VDLGRRAGEEAAAREDPVAEVADERVGQGEQGGHAGRRGVGRGDDDAVEDLLGGVDRRQLEILLRVEVGVQPALAHADLAREPTDREAVESLGRGESGGGDQDRLARAITVRSLSARDLGRHRQPSSLGSGRVSISNLARPIVLCCSVARTTVRAN